MQQVQDASLIVEGGTFRAIYSAGVLDAMMEEGIVMPYIAAISAGAVSAVSYMSEQIGRTQRVFMTYRNDPRYIGWRNFLKEKSYFGLDFAYNIIPNELEKFDWDTYFQYNGEVELGVTNAYTGQIEYMNAFDMDPHCQLLRATCAIPFIFPEIKINNIPYFDGGLSSSIPVQRAIDKGFGKHVLILTREEGYVKSTSRQTKFVTKLFQKKYPKLAKSMLERSVMYNNQLMQCKRLEATGQAFIFKPDYALSSFESKEEKMQTNYEMGYRHAKERMVELKAFLGLNE